MYRKKLMRVALAGIMTATVVTSSMPVRAAEPVATKQEKAVTKSVKINFYDEEAGKQVKEVEVSNLLPDTAELSAKVVKSYLPEGYELLNAQDNYAVADGYVYVSVKAVKTEKPEKPVTKSVKINFYDEEAGKQVKEVEVKNVLPDTAELSAKVVKSYLPEGYELLNAQDNYAVADGYVYVSVKAVKTEKPEKPVTKSVKINFYDEEAGKQVKEVEVKNVLPDTAELSAKVVKSYLPEGYELLNAQDNYAVADGYVYVSVKAVKTEKPEKPVTKSVKINFYDEEAGKQVKEVEVKNVLPDTAELSAKVVKSYLPEGYELLNAQDNYAVADGYVYVSVKAIKAEKPVVKETVLHVTFETTDGEVVGTDTAVETSVGAEGECWTFMLGKDFELPEGYVLTADPAYANQVVNVELPFGSAGGHTIVVDKVVAKTVEVTFIDEETKAPVGEKVNVEVKDGKINTTELTAPEGYEVCEKGDVAATAGAGLNVEVRKTEKTVYVSYIDEATKKPFENGIEEIKVASDAKAFNTSVLKKVPAGYELCVVGDVALNGDTVNVEVRKVPAKTQTVVVRFLENGKEVGLTTIEIEGNIFNTSILTAPEGYEIATLGDVQAQDGVAEVEVRKVSAKESIVKVQFVDADTDKVVAGGDYFVDADGDGIFNHSEVEKWVPEGYKLAEFGDFNVENYKETPLQLSVVKEKAEIPWTDLEDAKPVEKPGTQNQNTDKEENKKEDNKKKEDKKKAPKTSDEANPLAAAVPAGLSLAAILALLVKKFK